MYAGGEERCAHIRVLTIFDQALMSRQHLKHYLLES